MTDNTEKDMVVIDAEAEAEAKAPETEQPAPEAPAPENPTQEQPPKGGGFVWFLAFVLAVAIGGYAAWPYMGDNMPAGWVSYVNQVKTSLGLDQEPTKPAQASMQQNRPADIRAEAQPPAPVRAPLQAVVQAPTEPVFAPEPEQMPTGLAPNVLAAPGPQAPAFAAPAAPTLEAPTDVRGFENRLTQLEAERQPSGSDLTPLVQSLAQRLDVMESQLMVPPASRPAADGATLSREATGHISALIAELRAEVAVLKTRIAALESAPKGLVDPSASAQALVLSVTQLSNAVNDAGPFATNLAALERIGAADPVIATAIDRLQVFAETGVPTQAQLIENFPAMAVAVMQAHKAQARNTWWDEVTGTVSGLVTVRQTDPARIDDPVERALAVAELALGKRDVATAVGALSALQGAEGEAVQGWLNAAQARVEAADALSVLHNHAVAALSVTGQN